MKVVINDCFGGFGLSHEAVLRYFELKGIPIYTESEPGSFVTHYWFTPPHQRTENDGEYFFDHDLERNDPVLVQVVEELGRSADGEFASLKIVEIPDDVEWTIEEYDGSEHVAEKHRTWR